MDRKVKGITIMEVLVVMAIIAILASASILGLRNLVQRERLYSAMTQVANDLKEVQFRSMSSNNLWGVRFCANQSQYKIFAVDPATVGSGCPRDANTSCTNDATTQRLVHFHPVFCLRRIFMFSLTEGLSSELELWHRGWQHYPKE
jgi:prepilin-type N-terminal cleavage/methylation domain-containing protein